MLLTSIESVDLKVNLGNSLDPGDLNHLERQEDWHSIQYKVTIASYLVYSEEIARRLLDALAADKRFNVRSGL